MQQARGASYVKWEKSIATLEHEGEAVRPRAIALCEQKKVNATAL